MDEETDIYNYRVALLLIMDMNMAMYDDIIANKSYCTYKHILSM